MNDVHLQRHVVIHEIRQRLLICNDASHLCSRQKYIIRLFLFKKILYLLLSAQIQLLMRPRDDIMISGFFECADDSGAHHAAMSCHIDFCFFFHHDTRPLRLTPHPLPLFPASLSCGHALP